MKRFTLSWLAVKRPPQTLDNRQEAAASLCLRFRLLVHPQCCCGPIAVTPVVGN
jgi:hypothetical protein